ncbi:MAG: MarR family transcriptional regulator [Desulfobacteraceae bacterium]|nr:MarR family transcriptional regulator [Desulfobacteraceae bacterium]
MNMETPKHNFLDTCLFFNTNAFYRQLLKLAEVEFKPLKLSPAHASLLLLVFETPGIGPKELSRLLQLTPSTITRFIDSLVKKKLVRRKSKGKTVFIFPTQKSMDMQTPIALAYKKLYLTYSQILGTTKAMELSHNIATANKQVIETISTLEKHETQF